MAPTERSKWPDPYEAKCLLDELCRVSRELGIDWEVRSISAARPVGVIRDGWASTIHRRTPTRSAAWARSAPGVQG